MDKGFAPKPSYIEDDALCGPQLRIPRAQIGPGIGSQSSMKLARLFGVPDRRLEIAEIHLQKPSV